MESGDDLSSRAVTSQVLSTQKGLTTVFGMGTGGTPSPLSPEIMNTSRVSSCSCFLTSCSRSSRFTFHSALPIRFRFPYLQNLILESSKPSRLKLFLFIRFLRSSPRPISIDKLTHHCVYTVNLSTLLSSRGLTSLRCGILFLEVGFTLRCLQRLSRPYFASLLCRWHDNSCTRGTSIPVLSY